MTSWQLFTSVAADTSEATMSHHHDPFRCPYCSSTRTRSIQMVAMAGTHHGTARVSRATIGARGWWSISGNRARWTSQTALARRYAPAAGTTSGGFFALILTGAAIHGTTGAMVSLLLGLIAQIALSRNPPDGFVCLRCGCEFNPTSQRRTSQ